MCTRLRRMCPSSNHVLVILLITAVAKAPLSFAAGLQSAACPSATVAPPTHAVVVAALRHAGYDPERWRTWPQRLRWAPALPRVSVRMHQLWGEGLFLDLRPDLPDNIDSNVRYTVGWQILATWNLSRLVFDERELAIARTVRRTADDSRKLSERVIRFYFERKRLAARLCRTDPGDVEEAGMISLHLARVTAQLHEITGGVFFGPQTRRTKPNVSRTQSAPSTRHISFR